MELILIFAKALVFKYYYIFNEDIKATIILCLDDSKQ